MPATRDSLPESSPASPRETAPPGPGHLHRTFIHGFAWTTATKWLTQGVTWAGLFIATRLLRPADFGLSEMAGLVTIAANLLSEFGLGSAVLQMRHLTPAQLRQLNTVALFSGFGAVGFSFLAAHGVSEYFRQPLLRDLIYFNSLAFIPMALQMIPHGILQRDLDYRRLSILEAAFAVVQSAALVTAASLGAGAWSLATAGIAGRVVAAAVASFWRPVGFAWPRWAEIRDALRFGADISLSRLGSTIVTYADGVVIGRVLGDASLGAYRLALNLAAAPADKVGQLVMRVTGPLFARLQDNPAEMRRYFFVLSDVLCLAMAPMTVGFVLTAPDLIVAFAGGARWKEAIEPAGWLAAFLGLRSLTSLAQQALTSLRETRFLVWISAASFVILPAGFFFASHYGLGAIAAVWLLTSPLLFIPQFHRLLRRLEASWRDYLAVLAPTVFTALVMGAVVWTIGRSFLTGWNPWTRLGLLASAGCLVYGVLIYALRRDRLRDYARIIGGNI